MNKKYKRWQKQHLIRALELRRVVIVAGARQCGKTTLVKEELVPDALYYTLDDFTLLAAALNDPHGFVHHEKGLMIIDEIQKATILLPAIKKEVDENPQMGHFLLTGSANIQSAPGVNESLAGRLRTMRLRPLTQGEIEGTEPSFLSWAFEEKFPRRYAADKKDAYILRALRGGYPEPLCISSIPENHSWYADYIDSILQRDLKDIVHIKRQDAMRELLVVLAAWSSKAIDISSIASGLALSRQTITLYINALESLYLVERITPWPKTDYDRVHKQDKFFMTDTGLMASILQWQHETVRLNGDLNGKLLETFVFTQLMAHCEACNSPENTYRLYYYRDRAKHEIDFLIENTAGDLLGIEVKAGSAVSLDSFKHLKWFKEHLAKDRRFIGIVLYTGDQLASFGPAMWAVPMNILWSPEGS